MSMYVTMLLQISYLSLESAELCIQPLHFLVPVVEFVGKIFFLSLQRLHLRRLGTAVVRVGRRGRLGPSHWGGYDDGGTTPTAGGTCGGPCGGAPLLTSIIYNITLCAGKRGRERERERERERKEEGM